MVGTLRFAHPTKNFKIIFYANNVGCAKRSVPTIKELNLTIIDMITLLD